MDGDPTYDVLECDRRPTALGEALYIRIKRANGAPMGFREVYDVFAAYYPGRYAVQVFPPADRLFDQVNKYHLFVLDGKPEGLDLFDGQPKGAQAPGHRCRGTGSLRYGARPPGVPRPPRGERAACPGCEDCRRQSARA